MNVRLSLSSHVADFLYSIHKVAAFEKVQIVQSHNWHLTPQKYMLFIEVLEASLWKYFGCWVQQIMYAAHTFLYLIILNKLCIRNADMLPLTPNHT